MQAIQCHRRRNRAPSWAHGQVLLALPGGGPATHACLRQDFHRGLSDFICLEQVTPAVRPPTAPRGPTPSRCCGQALPGHWQPLGSETNSHDMPQKTKTSDHTDRGRTRTEQRGPVCWQSWLRVGAQRAGAKAAEQVQCGVPRRLQHPTHVYGIGQGSCPGWAVMVQTLPAHAERATLIGRGREGRMRTDATGHSESRGWSQYPGRLSLVARRHARIPGELTSCPYDYCQEGSCRKPH